MSAGQALGLPADRSYPSAQALFDAEAARADGADVVAIMTPNDSHFPYAMAALAQGFDVICDKPMTNTLAEAEQLRQRVQESGPRVLPDPQLQRLPAGAPGPRHGGRRCSWASIRLVQVEYVQGGRAKPGPGRTAWKTDPARGGASLVMGDIGTHAHQLLRFITGLEVEQVAADAGPIVPGSQAHDYAGALLRLSGGARGSFWVTQAAAGVENALRIRVSGSLGHPGMGAGAPAGAALQTAGCTGPNPHAQRARAPCRSPRGPAGWPQATPKAFTKPLPTCIPMPPKPLPRVAPGKRPTRSPCTFPTPTTAGWACGLWTR